MGELSGGAAGTATEVNEGHVFNMNDNLSVSYSQFDSEHKNWW